MGCDQLGTYQHRSHGGAAIILAMDLVVLAVLAVSLPVSILWGEGGGGGGELILGEPRVGV
jgi:hypothetical protein